MKMLSICLALFLGLFTISCSEKAKKENTGDVQESTVPAKKYTLTPFTKSQEYQDAQLRSVEYSGGTFSFDVGGDSYQLGLQTPDAPSKMCANSAQGQHIHLIVDDQPYAAKYEKSFEYGIADGEHHLLVFLSRSYHESIKTEAAHYAKIVNVKNNTIVESKDIEGRITT